MLVWRVMTQRYLSMFMCISLMGCAASSSGSDVAGPTGNASDTTDAVEPEPDIGDASELPEPSRGDVPDAESDAEDILPSPETPQVVWQKRIGGPWHDNLTGLAFDGSGLIAAGQIVGSAEFAGAQHLGCVVSESKRKTPFVTRLPIEGGPEWGDALSATDGECAQQDDMIALSASAGRIWVGGGLGGDATYELLGHKIGGGTTSSGSAEFDSVWLQTQSDESQVCGQTIESPDRQYVRSITALDSGGAVVVGQFFGQDGLSGDPCIAEAESSNMVVARTSVSTCAAESKRCFTSMHNGARHVPSASVADGTGNVIVVGQFKTTMEWSTCPDLSPGCSLQSALADQFDAFAVKLGPDLNVMWGRSLPAATSSTGVDVASDNTVWVVGDGTTDTNQPAGYVWVLDSGGEPKHVSTPVLWLPGPSTSLRDVAATHDGAVVVGRFSDDLVMQGASVLAAEAANGDDGFAMRVKEPDTDGDPFALVWALRLGGLGLDVAHRIVRGPGDTVFVGGNVNNSLLEELIQVPEAQCTDRSKCADAFIVQITL